MRDRHVCSSRSASANCAATIWEAKSSASHADKSVEQEYGVSHGTTEKAFAVLRAEGLIRPVVGRGHFVVRD